LEAANIVLATGATPNRDLSESLKTKFHEFYEVGDCVKPRRILEAIEEGFWAAVKI
jgi:2,4-dienoyl-CoA reductase (NADPH2)